MVQLIVEGDFSSIYSSSRYCSTNPNTTGNFSLLSLQTVSAQQSPLPVPVKPFPDKTRNLSLLLAQTVSAKQGPLPGQVAVCRHRTVTPNPVPVNPESFMEASRSAGALVTPGLPSQTEEHQGSLNKLRSTTLLYTILCMLFPLKYSTQLIHLIFPANFIGIHTGLLTERRPV